MKVVIEASWDDEEGGWTALTADDNPWHTHIATEGRDLEHLRTRLAELIDEFRDRGEADGVAFELVVRDIGRPMMVAAE